jgi:hypothetical protein
VSFTLYFVMCPSSINVSCAHYYVLSLVADVCVSFFDCQLIFIFSICDLVVSRSESREGINVESSIWDVLKSFFFGILI